MLQRLADRRRSVGIEMQQSGAHARVWAPSCRAIDVVLESGHDDSARARGGRILRDSSRTRRREIATGFRSTAHAGVPIPHRGSSPTASRALDDRGPLRRSRGRMASGAAFGRKARCCSCTSARSRPRHVAGAAHELPYLVDLGVTVIEVMPIADFAGRFRWGYDGVNLYAPTRLMARRMTSARSSIRRTWSVWASCSTSSTTTSVRRNYLAEFSPDYFTDRYENDWGARSTSRPRSPRAFFVENAAFDRRVPPRRPAVDATQDVKDSSPVSVLAEIVRSRAGRRPRNSSTSLRRTSRRTPRSWPVEQGYGANAL